MEYQINNQKVCINITLPFLPSQVPYKEIFTNHNQVPYHCWVPLTIEESIHSNSFKISFVLHKSWHCCCCFIKQLSGRRSSHGILLCPAASGSFILGPVSLVHVRNFRHKRIIGVGVRQQGANWQKDLKNSRISFLQGLKAYTTTISQKINRFQLLND